MRFCNLELYVILIVCGILGINCQKACKTPNHKIGFCVSLYDCKSILALLQGRVINQLERQFILDSKCEGGSGRAPYVCCSNQELRPALTTTVSPPKNVTFLLPDPAKYDCGTVFSIRIYGGDDSDIGESPWLAMLEYQNKQGYRGFTCGGSLINNRYILTAAHCVFGQIITDVGDFVNVRLGEYNLDTQKDCDTFGDNVTICADPPVNVGVQEVIVHPNYDPSDRNNYNDIALVRLAEPVNYTDWIRPICLPSVNFRDSNTNEQDEVVGFGRTLSGYQSNIKQKLKIDIYDHQKCKDKYKDKSITITDKQICAGGVQAQDTCQGDSGGPLIKVAGVSTLEGVVSFGNKCGLEGWPGVYTKVRSYIDWIRGNIKP